MEKNMKRKLRIFSNIAIICLSVCMFAFGVYAASTVSVTTSGTVSFNATDVHARITRTFAENCLDAKSEYENIDITYNAGTPNEQHDSFTGEKLIFASASTDIVMTFKIENLATEIGRDVYVGFTDNSSATPTNNGVHVSA